MFDYFFSLPSELMSAIATVIGFAYLGDLNVDEQNSLGNFLMLIGQILSTNAAQLQLLQNLNQTNSIGKLQAELDDIKSQLAKLSQS